MLALEIDINDRSDYLFYYSRFVFCFHNDFN